MAEMQYGKCYLKLGNNREAYKLFRKLQRKYPNNREVLKYLITVSRDLNLPYDDFHQKMRDLEDELIRAGPNIVYGQPPEDMDSTQGRSYGLNNSSGYNPNYQGEMVEFQSKKHQSNNQVVKPNYMKFKTTAEELLP